MSAHGVQTTSDPNDFHCIDVLQSIFFLCVSQKKASFGKVFGGLKTDDQFSFLGELFLKCTNILKHICTFFSAQSRVSCANIVYNDVY